MAMKRPNRSVATEFMALAVIGVMVLTGFAVLGPVGPNGGPAQDPEDKTQTAKTLVGSREATYSIDHMFELYQKSHDPADLGRWNGTMGLNEWWQLKEGMYQQYQARLEFPFVLVYPQYSASMSQGPSTISTWYRMTIDAKNITEIADGPNLDPIFTPVLGPVDTPGAYMNISWYGTYLETWEVAAIKAGTHYANTYYGVPANVTPPTTWDDGEFHELQGKLTFNRAAAAKILNLTEADDLRTQFATSDNNTTAAWRNNWVVEGGPGAGGTYDTWSGYGFPLDILWLELSLDPASTADNLVLRFWSVSWGNEFLLTRYMEAANVLRYWQGWPDDWYLNITIGPDGGDVHSRAVMGYHMYATKDTLNNINGWALEARHIDKYGNSGSHIGYPSPYNPYDPKQTAATHTTWAPFTPNFGRPEMYLRPPLHWNLTAGERIVVKLPASKSLPGYFPQASPRPWDDVWETKLEMAGNVTWGEMIAGNGYPNSGTNNLKNFYDKATKTYTLVGPLDFAPNWNQAFPGLLETGAPMFVMNVVQKHTMNLVTGWNLVSLPLVGYGYKASTLGLNVGDTVSKWDPPYHIYTSYVVGLPVNDFTIDPSVGYWINVPSGTRTLTLYGVYPTPWVNQTKTITLPGGGGWALIGFASNKTTMKAADVAKMYTGGAVTTVSKWNPATKSYTSWLSVIPTVNNYALVPGQGYWILASNSGTLSYAP